MLTPYRCIPVPLGSSNIYPSFLAQTTSTITPWTFKNRSTGAWSSSNKIYPYACALRWGRQENNGSGDEKRNINIVIQTQTITDSTHRHASLESRRKIRTCETKHNHIFGFLAVFKQQTQNQGADNRNWSMPKMPIGGHCKAMTHPRARPGTMIAADSNMTHRKSQTEETGAAPRLVVPRAVQMRQSLSPNTQSCRRASIHLCSYLLQLIAFVHSPVHIVQQTKAQHTCSRSRSQELSINLTLSCYPSLNITFSTEEHISVPFCHHRRPLGHTQTPLQSSLQLRSHVTIFSSLLSTYTWP